MPNHRRLRRTVALLVPVAVLATAGCGDDPGPVFNNQSGQQIRCLQHQAEPPGTRYTADPQHRDPGAVLAVLRYYTAHGRKPYCDGAAPTEADRAWAQFYVQQGAARSNVAPLLDS